MSGTSWSLSLFLFHGCRTNVIQKTGVCINLNGSIHIFGALNLTSAFVSEPIGRPWSNLSIIIYP